MMFNVLLAKTGRVVILECRCLDSLGNYVALRAPLKFGAGPSLHTLGTRLGKIRPSCNLLNLRSTDPQSQRLNAWHLRLLKQLEKLLLFNKCYWGNLARKKLLVDGDRSSRYFHQSARNRKRNCSILRIRDSSGVWLDDTHAIRP